jgi:hypothetical protein
MESSPINPGMGDDLNAVLSRLAALELELSKFQLIRIEVPVLGEPTQLLQVMAIREGAVTGGDYNIGYRQLTITQDSEPPWVNFSVHPEINRWIYVRGGKQYTDRESVPDPDDEGAGPGKLFPRAIHLFPIDNSGTAGEIVLEGDERGGWIEPVAEDE